MRRYEFIQTPWSPTSSPRPCLSAYSRGTFCEVNIICTLFRSGSRKSRAETPHYQRALWVWCGPMQGKPVGCLAHPDHHRGQTGYVSLILYLTETKSIVSPLSGFMCACHKKKRKRGNPGPLGGTLDGFKVSVCFNASLWSTWSVFHQSQRCNKEKISMMFFKLLGCSSSLVAGFWIRAHF